MPAHSCCGRSLQGEFSYINRLVNMLKNLGLFAILIIISGCSDIVCNFDAKMPIKCAFNLHNILNRHL